MIATALRTLIESQAAESRQTNPLFLKTAAGSLSTTALSRYLSSVRHIVKSSPARLAQARDRALEKGDDRLAAHFEKKRKEEIGHDAWAARDLERVSGPSPVDPGVVPTARAVVDYQARIIDEDPALYLAYALWAEYLVVLTGPAWLDDLEKRCGVPRSSMTIVDNHVELDKDHVQEALDEIDDLVGEPDKLPRMREVIRETMDHFHRFCAEVVAVPEVKHAPRAVEAAPSA